MGGENPFESEVWVRWLRFSNSLTSATKCQTTPKLLPVKNIDQNHVYCEWDTPLKDRIKLTYDTTTSSFDPKKSEFSVFCKYAGKDSVISTLHIDIAEILDRSNLSYGDSLFAKSFLTANRRFMTLEINFSYTLETKSEEKLPYCKDFLRQEVNDFKNITQPSLSRAEVLKAEIDFINKKANTAAIEEAETLFDMQKAFEYLSTTEDNLSKKSPQIRKKLLQRFPLYDKMTEVEILSFSITANEQLESEVKELKKVQSKKERNRKLEKELCSATKKLQAFEQSIQRISDEVNSIKKLLNNVSLQKKYESTILRLQTEQTKARELKEDFKKVSKELSEAERKLADSN